MSRVSEVKALQEKRVSEMKERMASGDVPEAIKMQLMIQNMTQTLNDISYTLAMIADENKKGL